MLRHFILVVSLKLLPRDYILFEVGNAVCAYFILKRKFVLENAILIVIMRYIAF